MATPSNPIASTNSLFGNLLAIIEAGTAALQLVPNPAIDAGAAVALQLEKIVAAALAAHQQATGQPLDLTKLQPIALVP